MAKQIYQLKITLKGTKPPIWRKITVDSSVSLNDLHRIIQITMGWENAHLHSFKKGKDEYAPVEFQLDYAMDSEKVRLNHILKKVNSSIAYEYDFGDGWNHEVKLEKILPTEEDMVSAKCIGGKRSCPPEDCGGVWGYAEMLHIIKDPKHEQYEDFIDWLGDDFDPDLFDIERVNGFLTY